MMPFEFAGPGKIVFGPDTVKEVPSLIKGFGTRVFVVTGRNQERAIQLLDLLESAGMLTSRFSVPGEPTVEAVQAGTQEARQFGCTAVIGYGGGSAIDAGKAIAALVTNVGDIFDYLEVIGKARPLTQSPIPFVAVPTTAGSGAEATRNAVLTSPEHQVKVSLRSPLMLPRVAVVDPKLTLSLPPDVTAATGLDALTQLIEPYLSNSPNPITDALCREGIRRAAGALERAFLNGEDLSARSDMALASLLGGLALANAKLGAVHGLAGPLGGMLPAPHGAICARLLPEVLAVNTRVLQNCVPTSPVLNRFQELAQMLTGNSQATISDGIVWIERLCSALKIAPLSRFGLESKLIPALVAQAKRSSSMKGNPVQLSEEELSEILERAL